MNIEAAKQIAHLTEINNHTEARILLAKQYAYCANLVPVFEAIKTIQNFYGYLPPALSDIRNDLTDVMGLRIEKADGIEEVELNNKLL